MYNKNNHTELIGQGIGALIVFIIIYNYWLYLLGAVVVLVAFREYSKQNNNRRD